MRMGDSDAISRVRNEKDAAGIYRGILTSFYLCCSYRGVEPAPLMIRTNDDISDDAPSRAKEDEIKTRATAKSLTDVDLIQRWGNSPKLRPKIQWGSREPVVSTMPQYRVEVRGV